MSKVGLPFVQVPWAKVRDLDHRLGLVEDKVSGSNSLYVNTAQDALINDTDLTAGTPNKYYATRGLWTPSLTGSYVQAIGDMFGKSVFVGKLTSAAATDTTPSAPLVRANTMVLVFPKAGIYNLLGVMRYLAQLSAFDRLTCGLESLQMPQMSLWSVGKIHYTALPTTGEFLSGGYTALLDSYPNWWSTAASYGEFRTDGSGVPTRFAPLAPHDELSYGWVIRSAAQEYNGEHVLRVHQDAQPSASGGFDAIAVMPLFWQVNTIEGTDVLPRISTMTSKWRGQLVLDVNPQAGVLTDTSYWDGAALPSIVS